ncbi:hypothetical protein L2E82_08826 [Cichorium intybus]|uniref:Uncharacterized protein n=1 Tax=Cichorium intybus TaxID=13427 RepID=A0ACB9G8Y1_CICIN|nr:hypothetical protein L2E82_08826 [Cichorium intybus]
MLNCDCYLLQPNHLHNLDLKDQHLFFFSRSTEILPSPLSYVDSLSPDYVHTTTANQPTCTSLLYSNAADLINYGIVETLAAIAIGDIDNPNPNVEESIAMDLDLKLKSNLVSVQNLSSSLFGCGVRIALI